LSRVLTLIAAPQTATRMARITTDSSENGEGDADKFTHQ